MLETLDLSLAVDKTEYKSRLTRLQSRLHQLQRACWTTNLATLVVFEGWGASGKGNVIRKLTQRLEPRGFSLHAIQEPRTVERHLPWMWRFWVRLPNWGHMGIFSHSWYWRVLAQRLQGEIDERQTRQAFNDIVSFERALADDRYLIVKYFLHIDEEEQQKRLEKLEADPQSAWQVRSHDWQQHKEYKRYLLAVEEMLERTESEWGPWTLIEGHDHRWERLRVFETLIASMEEGLERKGYEAPEPLADDDDDMDEEG